MRQAASIVCIGGANVDRKARLLTPFRLGTSHPVVTTQTAGGVARNVAENLGRFGHTVSLVSAVGDDRDGQWLIDVTSRYVNTSFIMRTPKANTGTYTAVLDECGEMVLALADMVIYDTVGKEWMKQRWPELGPISAVVLDTNFPKAVIRLVIEQCRQEDIPLCVVTVSAPKVKRLPSDLSGVTWLITNEAEAKAFVGSDGHTDDIMEAILHAGAKNVVITSGANGVAYAAKQGETGTLAAPKVDVVDATGAGDAFAAGFLHGVLNGHTMKNACYFGMSNAALTLQTTETVNRALNEQVLHAVYKQYFRQGGMTE
ncbi:Pseudouridine kinase [Geobacillus sp. BCO2]|nr:Pseudouridine kinase [Geobacillus sp. BCO2]